MSKLLGTHTVKRNGAMCQFKVYDTIVKTLKANKIWYYSAMPILSELGYKSIQTGRYPVLVKTKEK